MKPSLKLILAGMVLAGGAFAQPEQWLEYHTGTEGRAYHQMKLTTNPPPGVALPKLNAPPYFARWLTPMDPAGGRWLCLDRTRKSGPYDRLFIDSNGNGRLDDKTPVQARLDSYTAYFPAGPPLFSRARTGRLPIISCSGSINTKRIRPNCWPRPPAGMKAW